MYATDTERVNAVRDLVDNAVRSGALASHQAESVYAIVGRPVQASTITISLRATGDTSRVAGATHQIEEALQGLARQAGLTIERGSVNARVGA